MDKPTPMMAQYLQMKEAYKDTILFFRLGDFYEMFYEDALTASRELEITLTRRDKKNNIPMCGVPYHSAKGYIERLIEKGFKVAIAEQMEDPKSVKGMVKREVVKVITPGTVMDDMLSDDESNYIMSIYHIDERFGIAYSDVSTGVLKVTMCNEQTLLNEASVIQPKEIILNRNLNDNIMRQLSFLTSVISVQDEMTSFEQNKHLTDELSHAPNMLLTYIQSTQQNRLDHIEDAEHYEPVHYMRLDMYAKRNLELTESIRLKSKKGTLLSIFKESRTPMGNRLLKEWIERPLIYKEDILKRHRVVDCLSEAFMLRHQLREALRDIYDIERLSGRVQFGNVTPKDLVQLKYSLQQLPVIAEMIQPYQHIIPSLDELDRIQPLTELLEASIQDEAPMNIKDGNIFKNGWNDQLDEYRGANQNGKLWLTELQAKERERTGIKSLKISYNKVFGYYIEITKANLNLVDPEKLGYTRKQTLSNAERFITEELKEKEELILGAEEKALELEYQLFIQLREIVKTYIPDLKLQARKIAELDVLQNFSETAVNYHYVKPEISTDGILNLKNARHPVVEQVMKKDEYVSNDCVLNKEQFIYMITGPNMSGKSTYMRQVALISIMAQMGSFVPCDSAEVPIFDQIFTRIGAADDLVSGQSTFMVEMLEARNALMNATENSLIIFDEIGRGTSTYDGLSLAQSMIEYVHHHIGAKTLFSTHYHELVQLEDALDGLTNIHVAAKEYNGELIFLHKIMPGAVENSYGIHVAKLADLPDEIISRASSLLETFEHYSIKDLNFVNKQENVIKDCPPEQSTEYIQTSFNLFDDSSSKVEEELRQLEINTMTPIEALVKLQELKALIKQVR